MRDKKCDGGCADYNECRGDVQKVVLNWDGDELELNYCEEAISTDIERGFNPQIKEEKI